jgi:hypothetical protein
MASTVTGIGGWMPGTDGADVMASTVTGTSISWTMSSIPDQETP